MPTSLQTITTLALVGAASLLPPCALLGAEEGATVEQRGTIVVTMTTAERTGAQLRQVLIATGQRLPETPAPERTLETAKNQVETALLALRSQQQDLAEWALRQALRELERQPRHPAHTYPAQAQLGQANAQIGAQQDPIIETLE